MKTTNHNSHLIDLEEMILKCRDDASRELIQEAVNSYYAGAYRASIVTTWIAVFVDLAGKIRSLSLAGDAEAVAWIDRYEDFIEKYDPNQANTVVPFQRVEGVILNDARDKFQLLTALDWMDLRRLRADRHRCAHPAMRTRSELFSPSAELARAAFEHCLIRPAIRGNLAVERILITLLDEGFPVDSIQAAELVRGMEIRELGLDSQARLFSRVLHDIFDTESSHSVRTRRLVALTALRNDIPASADEKLPPVLSEFLESQSLSSWNTLLELVKRIPWLTSYLESIQLGRLFGFIEKVGLDDFDGASFLVRCMGTDFTRDEALKRISSIPVQFLSIKREEIPSETTLDEGVKRLSRSDSWSQTYTIAERLIIPNVDLLTRSQIVDIRNAVLRKPNVSGSVIMLELIREVLLLNDPAKLGPKDSWHSVISKCSNLTDEQKRSLEGYIDNAYSEDPIPF